MIEDKKQEEPKEVEVTDAKEEELESEPDHIQEEVCEDMETLIKAMDIMKDSSKMKKIKDYAEVKKKKIESLSDLRAEALKIPIGQDKVV